jgi:WD40 repeat protein
MLDQNVRCASFKKGSSNNNTFATLSFDNVIRIYSINLSDKPIKIWEHNSQENLLNIIKFSNYSNRFLNVGEDGSVLIWTQNYLKKWQPLLIDTVKSFLNRKDLFEAFSLLDINRKYDFSLVSWNSNDTLIITVLNKIILIWDSNDAKYINSLEVNIFNNLFHLIINPQESIVF